MSYVKSGKVNTISFIGINIKKTYVECTLLSGIPSFIIVGLGGKTISESKERVRSALITNGFIFPNCKIVINLSPADIYKEGSHYDLPIAIAILCAMNEINNSYLDKSLIIGELALNGDILFSKGVLPTVIFANKQQYNLVCGDINKNEIILPISVCTADNLKHLVIKLQKNNFELNTKTYKKLIKIQENIFDTIYGQEIGKRALIIAAAGRHNIVFIGQKGVGKSMLAKSINDLLPPLDEKEALDITSIHSIAGNLNFDNDYNSDNSDILSYPVFRNPHSSSSLVSIVGGGSTPQPGEISLAHNGILFLDELPEFNSIIIDSLRIPLEEKVIYISRVKYKIGYPADFQLLVAMNPCKCGNLLISKCVCGKKNYMNRVSSPIWDRIEIKVILNKSDFNFSNKGISMVEAQNNILKARKKQKNRFNNYNSRVNLITLEQNGNFCENTINLVKDICIKKSLSGRSYLKCLSVARTIADLDNSDNVKKEHILEAIFFIDMSSIGI